MTEVTNSIAYLAHEPLQPLEDHSEKLMYFLFLTPEITKINV